MDVQAELANAIKQRFGKVQGVSSSTNENGKNERSGRREEMSEAEKASRSKSKKAATAALLAKMGNRQPASSPAVASMKQGTAAGSAPLNKTEEDIAERYRKMMKMGLPEGAVRHKMVTDGISERIVGAVMSGESLSSPRASVPQKLSAGASSGNSSLSFEEDKIAEKYRKMAKFGMPEGAVLHKMIADGVSQKIQDAVMTGEPSSAILSGTVVPSSTASNKNAVNPAGTGQSSKSSLSADEEKIAAQYRTMIRIKMPQGAVRHKMIADGVSAKIQDSVLRGEIPQSFDANNTTSSITSEVSSLSPEEEKIATQYRTMIKIKMPQGAVRHKMIADGVPAIIQDSVLRGEIPGPSSPSSSSLLSSRESKPKRNISSLSREDEKKATPYRKMMKMGLPEGAVKHKMTRDNISVSIQNSVLREEIPSEDSLKDNTDNTALLMRPTANPLNAAITSSGGSKSLKRSPVEEKKPISTPSPSNPLAAAIASTGGIRSLKKTTIDEKKHSAASVPSNPLIAAIASSGGIGSLQKSPRDKKKTDVVAGPSNPLVAAIKSSGGIGSLKKKSTKTKKTVAVAVPANPPAVAAVDSVGKDVVAGPSNPLVAAIKSSGGIGSLKKKSTKTKKTVAAAVPSNPLAVAAVASVGKSDIKKTPVDDKNLQLSKIGNRTNVLDEVSSEKSPKESHGGSNHEAKRNYPPSHLSGIKIKSVQSKDKSPNHSSMKVRSKRSPEKIVPMVMTKTNHGNSSNSAFDTDKNAAEETPQRSNYGSYEYDSQMKSMRSPAEQNYISYDDKVKSVKLPEEPLIRRTDFANEVITRRFEAEKQLSKSTITIGSLSVGSINKTESASKSLEEQPVNTSKNGHVEKTNSTDVRMKSRRSHQEHPIPNNSAQSGSKKSYFGFQSATKNEGNKLQNTSSVNQDTAPRAKRSSKLSDYSQRSRTGPKKPNSKVRNSEMRRTAITTEDGVDHHCQCALM